MVIDVVSETDETNKLKFKTVLFRTKRRVHQYPGYHDELAEMYRRWELSLETKKYPQCYKLEVTIKARVLTIVELHLISHQGLYRYSGYDNALINATRYPPPYGHGSGFDIASYQSILRYAVKSSLSKGSGFDHRF